MGKRTLVSGVAIVTCLLVAAPSQAAKTVTTKWKVSYAWSASYANQYDLPADRYCPGVHWAETAQASATAAFPKLKLKLASGATAVANGPIFVAPTSTFEQKGNYHPENDCGQPAQPAECAGAIGYSSDDASALLSVEVKGGTAYFRSGVGGGLAERTENTQGCNDGFTRLAEPFYGFGGAADPWGNVVAKVKLKELARKKRIKLFPKPDDFGADYDPVTCQKTAGCEATFDIRRSVLTLVRR